MAELPRAPSLALKPVQRAGVHVYAWGRDDMGQLGVIRVHDSSQQQQQGDSVSTPVEVTALATADIVHVAAGPYNTAFLTAEGELYTCGANDTHQLGVKAHTQSTHTQPHTDTHQGPGSAHQSESALSNTNTQQAQGVVRVGALDVHKLIHVAYGQNHALAVTDKGQCFSWGDGEWGQLGLGTDTLTQAVPKPIKLPRNVRVARVAAGECHSIVLSTAGQVYTWGQGTFGALGHGNEDNCHAPTHVQSLWPMGIVQVSCGEHHSAALAADGRLFTWGRGKAGALGHGDFNSLSHPQLVRALKGLPLVQVTIGPVPTTHKPTHGSGTLPLPLPRLLALTHTAATELTTHEQNSSSSSSVAQDTGSPRIAAASVPSGGGSRSGSAAGAVGPALAALLHGIEDVFTSPGYLAAEFAQPTASAQSQLSTVTEAVTETATDSNTMDIDTQNTHSSVSNSVSSGGAASAADATEGDAARAVVAAAALSRLGCAAPSLDTQAITTLYQALLKLYSPQVVTALAAACASLLDTTHTALIASAPAAGRVPPAAAAALAATILPSIYILTQNPINAQPIALPAATAAAGGSGGGGTGALWRLLCGCWLGLPAEHMRMLAGWVGALPHSVLGGRVVRGLQQYVSRCVERGSEGARRDALMAAQVLTHIREAQMLLERETSTWGNTAFLGARPGEPGYHTVLEPLAASEWCNTQLSDSVNLREEYMTPILLTPESKSRIMQGIHPSSVAFLDVHVRRSHVLQDALTQILNRPEELKKPLRVTFIGPGGVAEEGLDEGGVSREFFQLLVAEIFRPEYGMFTWSDETRTYWFSTLLTGSGDDSHELELEFKLVGAVLGLAIYNNIILNVHFPLIVYKKLLGHTPGWRDLCDTQPQLAKGLSALLLYEGDVENTFCRTFEVEYEYLGSVQKKELIPNGANTPVTEQNGLQLLEGSVEAQFRAFKQGFLSVCGGPALTLLEPHELELLVAGLPHLDFVALEKGAKYDGGYTSQSPAVRWFWETLHAMALEQKKRFLAFTTGCDRAPVGGLGKLTLTIQRKLRELLLTAIENAQGFGLM